MSGELIAFNDLTGMANTIAKSGMLGTKSPEDALTIMLVAQSEGRHPGSIIKDYHIINGKPTLRADAMQARFQQAGGRVEWLQLNNEVVEAKFTYESGGTVTIKWTIEDAKNAGLTKNPTWGKYPRSMLRSRVVSEGIKTVCPNVISGFYTPEEQMDIPPQQVSEPRIAEAEVIETVSMEDRKRVSDYASALGWDKETFVKELGINSTSEMTPENKLEIFSKLDIVEEN